MRHYERMVGLTQIPGRDTDWLHHSDSVHVAVTHKGVWWRVGLFDLSDNKSPGSAGIASCLLLGGDLGFRSSTLLTW